MGRSTSKGRRLALAGCVALAAGGVLLGTAAVASAATPSITLSQSSFTGTNTLIAVSGSGFTAKTTGSIEECPVVSGEPTISILSFGNLGVGCTPPTTDNTNASGALPAGTTFGVLGQTSLAPTLGPPAAGTDSSGGDATKDALGYPCPPTAAQVAAGGTCEVLYVDAKGEMASQNITFNFESTTTSTTSTVPTTTAPCNAQPATASNVNAMTGTTATVTVTPGTCLAAGTSVVVTGTGLVPNSLGSILECNTDGSQGVYAGTANATLSTIASGSLAISNLLGKPDPSGNLTVTASGGVGTFSYTGVTVSGTNATFTGLALTAGTGSWTVATGAFVNEGQPYITFLGVAIPVSCSKVQTFTTTATGGIASTNQQFTVIEGTTGPPSTGTDSNGVDGATDAANYPCPPTAAEVAKGDGCVIAVGDIGGDKVPVPISFNLNAPPVPTTTTTAANTGNSSSSGGSGSSGNSAAASTSAHGGTLAFTGSGPRLWWVALVGIVLMVLGAMALVVVDLPRRLLRLAVDKARSRGQT